MFARVVSSCHFSAIAVSHRRALRSPEVGFCAGLSPRRSSWCPRLPRGSVSDVPVRTGLDGLNSRAQLEHCAALSKSLCHDLWTRLRTGLIPSVDGARAVAPRYHHNRPAETRTPITRFGAVRATDCTTDLWGYWRASSSHRLSRAGILVGPQYQRSRRVSLPLPLGLQPSALLFELHEHKWPREDLNLRSSLSQSDALSRLSYRTKGSFSTGRRTEAARCLDRTSRGFW